jgi:hypothetical protein
MLIGQGLPVHFVNQSSMSLMFMIKCSSRHKMYAKMILAKDEKKSCHRIEDVDQESYLMGERMLPNLWQHIRQLQIRAGYNTNHVLRYNYRYW